MFNDLALLDVEVAACHRVVEGTLEGVMRVLPDLYNVGNCNLTGDHYFRLLIRSVTSSNVSWRWTLDGAQFGPTLTLGISNSSFQRKTAGVISEIVDPNNIGSNASFPTVTYNPAIGFLNSSGNWVGAQNGFFTESSDNICRYALKVLADNSVRTGLSSNINPSQCYTFGDQLW